MIDTGRLVVPPFLEFEGFWESSRSEFPSEMAPECKPTEWYHMISRQQVSSANFPWVHLKVVEWYITLFPVASFSYWYEIAPDCMFRVIVSRLQIQKGTWLFPAAYSRVIWCFRGGKVVSRISLPPFFFISSQSLDHIAVLSIFVAVITWATSPGLLQDESEGSCSFYIDHEWKAYTFTHPNQDARPHRPYLICSTLQTLKLWEDSFIKDIMRIQNSTFMKTWASAKRVIMHAWSFLCEFFPTSPPDYYKGQHMMEIKYVKDDGLLARATGICADRIFSSNNDLDAGCITSEHCHARNAARREEYSLHQVVTSFHVHTVSKLGRRTFCFGWLCMEFIQRIEKQSECMSQHQ